MAVLWGPRSRLNLPYWQAAEADARERGWKLLSLEVQDAGEIEGAFKAATRARAGALLVLPRVLEWHARRITELAAKSRLPAMYAQRHYVETGGLMFYGANGIELYRRAAVFVEAPSPPTCRSSSQRSSNW